MRRTLRVLVLLGMTAGPFGSACGPWSGGVAAQSVTTLQAKGALLAGPEASAAPLLLIDPGTPATVDGSPVGNYYPVTVNGVSGWLPGELLAVDKGADGATTAVDSAAGGSNLTDAAPLAVGGEVAPAQQAETDAASPDAHAATDGNAGDPAGQSQPDAAAKTSDAPSTAGPADHAETPKPTSAPTTDAPATDAAAATTDAAPPPADPTPEATAAPPAETPATVASTPDGTAPEPTALAADGVSDPAPTAVAAAPGATPTPTTADAAEPAATATPAATDPAASATPAPTAAPTPTPTPAPRLDLNGQGTVATDVVLRAEPNDWSAIVFSVPAGSTVNLTGQEQDGWVSAEFFWMYGWLPEQLVDPAAQVVAEAPTSTPPPDLSLKEPKPGSGVAYTTVDLTLRSGPSADEAAMDTVPAGQKVVLTGVIQNGFQRVTWGDEVGWLADAFLQTPDDPQPQTKANGKPVYSRNDIVKIIYQAADRYGQSRDDMLRVATCESNLDPNAVNPSGSYGLFQFIRSTWKSTPYGDQDIFDPKANANAAGWMWQQGRQSEWVCK